MRSRKDFNAFNKLVPFERKTHRSVRCSDPALAVYLLQQSIEKAIKAIAVASGRYPHRKLRRFSHNSLALFLDFYDNTLSLMLSSMRLKPMFDAFGLDAVGGLDKIRELKGEAKKTAKGKKKGETVHRDEYASMSPEAIDGLLNFLLIIRKKAVLGVLSSVFGPHSKVRISGEAIEAGSSKAFVDSMLSEVRTKLNIPELTEEQRKALITFHGVLSSIQPGVTGDQSTEKTIELGRDTDEWLGQWAMIALILLAAITFPHESTSRYPVPKGRTRELGCGDYDEKLGIVNRLGQLGYVVELAIDEIEPQLETVAIFFSGVAARLLETER
jgi:hypothetical protein